MRKLLVLCLSILAASPMHAGEIVNGGYNKPARQLLGSGVPHPELPQTSIDVDSLIAGIADRQIESNQASAQFGYSVARLGDVNGDGFQDLAIGAPYWDNGQADEGSVFLFLGSATGVGSVPDAMLEADQASARFGISVAGAGDVNGDGYDDIVVGAELYESGVETDEGAAYIYFGGPGAFNTVADAVIQGNQSAAYFGSSVAGAGDVNGDGFADVLVGAFGYDATGSQNEGAAYLFFGGAGAFNIAADARLSSGQLGARAGTSVAGAGDVNGDGYADVLVGVPQHDVGPHTNTGAALLYFGGAGAFNVTFDAVLQVSQANAELGASVAAAGDVNGDGYSDVIVGAALYDDPEVDEGAAFIYFGGVAPFDTVADVTLELNQPGAALGFRVAGAGDVNGDNYADVIVGANLYDAGQTDEGAAFVYLGNAAGVATAAAFTLESNQAQARTAFSAAAADVNGDGYADIAVGIPGYTNGQTEEGSAFVYHGGSRAPDTDADGQVESDQLSGQAGHSVATGDVNGDGYDDLIVGAYGYDSASVNSGNVFVYFGNSGGFNAVADASLPGSQADARFGASVAAGDVNGDGFADVIVGAPLYNQGVTTDAGQVSVYYGSSGPFDSTADRTMTSSQAGAQLGYSVGFAGDINGDGYGDVVAGAPYLDTQGSDEGALLVYFGSRVFTGTVAATLPSGQAAAYLGTSVAGVGDVNGDGFADIAGGAPGYDGTTANDGALFVYFGGLPFDQGVDSRPLGGQTSARLGNSIAAAGDVNGDGYADVVAGATEYSNGQANEGRVLIYRGGAGAFSTTAFATLEMNQAGARFGSSVAGGADLNADGYSDIVVGAFQFDTTANGDEGALFAYLGGAGAFDTSVDVEFRSNQLASRQGFSAVLGDINGDGYADIVGGVPSYNGGLAEEGAALVFLGNGAGRGLIPQQFRSTTPVAPWGASQSASGFSAAMQALGPRGRERSRLQLEACPAGAVFGGPSCTRTTAASWTDTTSAAAGVATVANATGLNLNAVYHWRVRSLYAPFTVTQTGITAPPNPAASPWRRMEAGGGVADIRVIEFIFRNGFQ